MTILQRALAFLPLLIPSSINALIETDRLREYAARNYTWPLSDHQIVPNTAGWKRQVRRRLAQVERITNDADRYNGWVSIMAAAVTAPNFTEHGWGLARAPAALMEELMASLHEGLPTAEDETFINVIEGEGEERPLFIRQPRLNRKVLNELKPLHEEWSGVSLTGAVAYGLRVYRNHSSLFMHVDKSRTHVISCILHVDHSEDSEPWPILIEDFQGNTNEVVLESGDLMFYESSKCIHGRPHKFNGSWYSSIFVHYFPTGWNQEQAELNIHYAIPPHWHTTVPPDPNLEKLVMVGTSMREPGCTNGWCGLQDTVKWFGPGKEGMTISTGYRNEAGQIKDEL